MSRVEEVSILQKAVIWDLSGRDNYGQEQVSEAREIDCEWPQNFTESQGNQDTKESSNDTLVVNEDLTIGSILWFGAEVDLPTGTASPEPLYVIVGRSKSPDIKGRKFRRTITVARYSSTLPEII